ncbi:MAG: hypothetical protein WBW94_07905 [Anaerolineales bacterium]
MAKDQTKRLRPILLQADRDALTAIRTLSDYQPANPSYAADKLGSALTAMQSAQQAEVNAQNALDTARDAANQAEWGFHNSMLGAKVQVVAQYGDDSDAVQSLGLTKKSERKSPVRKSKSAA